MKKIFLFCLMAMLCLSGCTPQPSTPSSEMSGGNSSAPQSPAIDDLDTSQYDGVFAQYRTLTDPVTGVPVMDVLLPHGWAAQVVTDWSFVSTTNPCIATISLTSPGGDATVILQTPHNYLQSYDTAGLMPHWDGVDRETYITRLAYRDAGGVLDLCFNGLLTASGTMISETPVEQELQNFLDQYTAQYAVTMVNGLNSLGGGYGISAQLSGYEGKLAFRRYRCVGHDGGNYVADACCLTIGVQYIMPSYGLSFVYTEWGVPFTIIYLAQNEETLNKYSRDYEVIVNNSVARPEFDFVKLSYGRYIRNLVMQQLSASISAMTEAQAQSYMQDYSSSSQTDSDEWADAWGDYIYDRNEYTTTDGKTLKVGTEYDVVYQNGDEYYFGSQGDAPFGWEQLNRN